MKNSQTVKRSKKYHPPDDFYCASNKSIRRALRRIHVGPYDQISDAGAVYYERAIDVAAEFLYDMARELVGSPYQHRPLWEIRNSDLGRRWAYVAAVLELEGKAPRFIDKTPSPDVMYIKPALAPVLTEAKIAAQEHGFGAPLSARPRLPRGHWQHIEAHR